MPIQQLAHELAVTSSLLQAAYARLHWLEESVLAHFPVPVEVPYEGCVSPCQGSEYCVTVPADVRG